MKGKPWALDKPLPKSGVVFSCNFVSGNLGHLAIVRDPAPTPAAAGGAEAAAGAGAGPAGGRSSTSTFMMHD